MQSRCEYDVILQLVSCTFLHLQSAISDTEPNPEIQKSKKTIAMNEGKLRKRTDP